MANKCLYTVQCRPSMIYWKNSEPKWNIGIENCLAWYIAQAYDCCIPLDFWTPKISKKLKKTKNIFEGQTQSPKSSSLCICQYTSPKRISIFYHLNINWQSALYLFISQKDIISQNVIDGLHFVYSCIKVQITEQQISELP